MSDHETENYQEKLTRVKQDFDNFVYLVSHDLKAPIRAINNLADWVMEDLGPDIPANAQRQLHLLRERSQRLDKMLAAILELSRVARMNLQIETIALSPFLHRIRENFAQDGITFSIPDNLPVLTTYAAKLQTVIEQLFDNAIKHNPNQPVHLTITWQPDQEYLKLLVSDNGIGILPEQREKVFNIFYTGRGKEEQNSIGAGLTISKKIVEFVGGKIEITENSPAGSTFILYWPFKIIQKP